MVLEIGSGTGTSTLAMAHAEPDVDVVAVEVYRRGLAQLLMTSSLQHAPVSVLAPLDYLQMVGAVVLGWLLMNDAPTAGISWMSASVYARRSCHGAGGW